MPGAQETTALQETTAWLFSRTRKGKARDPARMQRIIEGLDLKMPPAVIHVVGTNGKGSVTTIMARAFENSGLTVGRFISPHIERYHERIVVNGQEIDDAFIMDFVSRVRIDAALADSAFFELTLGLALDYFALKKVNLAVIEAGVGARNDATMCVTNVIATVITNVELDHQDTLGAHIKDIALDKAAAIRPHRPVITGAHGEALDIIHAEAQSCDSPCISRRSAPELFAVKGSKSPFIQDNQALAAAALRTLGQPESSIQEALSARLPGRFERFELRGREVILDGAHNPSAVRCLVANLSGYTLIFAALPKKAAQEMFDILVIKAEDVFLTYIPPYPFAFETEREIELNHHAALAKALDQTVKGATILITGSLYLVSLMRPLLKNSHRP